MHAYVLDTSSQEDVRRFARQLNQAFPYIHFLVNNAGVLGDVGGRGREDTVDGFEKIVATNYLGPFALTHLLLDKLSASGKPGDPARVVHVSSVSHYFCNHFDYEMFDINARKSAYGAMRQYEVSKLLQVSFEVDKLKAQEINASKYVYGAAYRLLDFSSVIIIANRVRARKVQSPFKCIICLCTL